MIIIGIRQRAGAFAEDKDVAANIRDQEVKPAIERGDKVRLDFSEVDGATQSFVHALISEPIRKSGAGILDKIEFKQCNPTVRSVVEIVVEYSQLAERGDSAEDAAQQAAAPDDRKGKARVGRRRAARR